MSADMKEFKKKVEEMNDEDDIQALLDATNDPDYRKVVRARLRVVRVKKRELRENRLAEGEQAMVQSKQKMHQDAKQSELDSYQMKYSASSKSESYHESSVSTTTKESG